MSFGDFLLIGLALVSIVVVPRAIWRAWTQPVVPEDAAPRRPAPPPLELPPVVRGLVEVVKRPFMVYDDDGGGPIVMSHQPTRGTIENPVSATIAGQQQNDGQGIAKPSTPVNDVLPGNALPEEVREIIRFQAKVEAVVDLINSGEMAQTKAITIVFRCKPSGREGSVYARARDAVQERLTPAPRYRELDEHKRPAELSQAGAE